MKNLNQDKRLKKEFFTFSNIFMLGIFLRVSFFCGKNREGRYFNIFINFKLFSWYHHLKTKFCALIKKIFISACGKLQLNFILA